MLLRLLKAGMLKCKNPKGFLSVLLFSITIYGYSQQYDLREYSDVLAQPYVYSIIQDTNGYLWIGTGNGLSKYDGFKFISYTSRDSLADNFITCSLKKGNDIFFGHMNGKVSHYNGKVFVPIITSNQNTSITDIENSPNGDIWAGTYGSGLLRIEEKAGNLQNTEANNQITIISFKFITDNEILVGSVNGLSHCSIDRSGKIQVIRHFNEIPGSKIPDIIKMRNDSGYIVATENDGIFQIMQEDKKFKVIRVATEFNIDFSGIQSIFEDSKLSLWICTFGNGLIKLDYSSTSQFSKATYLNKTTGFSTNNVKTAFEDREGNIWSGNYGTGLIQITKKVFSFYALDKISYGTAIYSIYTDNDIIWLGTEKGLFKVNQSNEKILALYSSHHGLPNDKITAIYSEQGKALWIGTENKGVYRMIVDQEIIHPYKIGIGLLENSITAITGSNNQIWIGTKKGVCNLNLVTNKIQWYTLEKGGLPHNFVNHLLIDSKGKLWVSTIGNTLAYIQNGKVGKILIKSEKGVLSLGSLVEDHDSSIWIGSYGGGIFRIESDSIANITSKEGLFSDYCYSLLTDGNDNVWVGHQGGLSRIRTTNLLVRSLQQFVGINSNCEFIKNAISKDNKNRIWFGSDKGLWVYDPALENQVLLPPVLNITSFKVNGVEIGFKDKLILPSGHYKIIIEYLGINLTDPANVNYKYQLVGYDQSLENTKNKSVIYPNLNDGEYKFFIWTSTGDGVSTETPLTLNIIIKTSVWKQWWFYVIIFVTLIAIVLFYIKRREYIFQQEKQILEAKVEERTSQLARNNSLLKDQKSEITYQNIELEKYRKYLEQLVDERTHELLIAKNKAEESDRLKTAFLNNMSHEIRTPLNAVCGFSRILNEDTVSEEDRSHFINIIEDNTQSLLYMINEIMDISILESMQSLISDEKFNIDDLLNELENRSKLKNKKQIEIEYINKDKATTKLELYYDKKRFYQLFNNLLNNALKYTESGQIKFGYKLFEKSVRFYVSDTGIGIDQSEFDKIFDSFYKIDNGSAILYRGAGIGLTICKKIVELMGGELWLESVVNKGSVFYFTLPLTSETADKQKDKTK